jgi:hypothetical protein
MKFGDYLSLLRENRFQIHPARYPMTALVGASAACNSAAAAVQRLLMHKKIANTEIEQPPIFVIGHWRSGTTLMHELLSMDDRFAFPNTLDTFTPNHFLVTRYVLGPMLSLLLPNRRPMDDMTVRINSPQEDDFALCAYGAPTPYRRVAFPNRKGRDHVQLNLSLAEPAQRLELQKALEHFLKSLTIRYGGKRLVLKSPPHTGRIKQLAQWFPQAKFIHLSRHPHKVVSSTMRLWKLLDEIQGFQLPKYDDNWLRNYVFECKDLMYQAYFSQRDLLPSNQLVEVRFESLLEDPTVIMRGVYEQLELEGFDQFAPKVDSYFDSRKSHKMKTTDVDAEFAEDIDHHWSEYMEAFGYGVPA